MKYLQSSIKALLLTIGLALSAKSFAFDMTKQGLSWDVPVAAIVGQSLYMADNCENLTAESKNRIKEISASFYYPSSKLDPTRLQNLRKMVANSYLKSYQDRIFIQNEAFPDVCTYFEKTNQLENINQMLNKLNSIYTSPPKK